MVVKPNLFENVIKGTNSIESFLLPQQCSTAVMKRQTALDLQVDDPAPLLSAEVQAACPVVLLYDLDSGRQVFDRFEIGTRHDDIGEKLG